MYATAAGVPAAVVEPTRASTDDPNVYYRDIQLKMAFMTFNIRQSLTFDATGKNITRLKVEKL